MGIGQWIRWIGIFLLAGFAGQAEAQVTEAWVRTYNGPGNSSDFASAIAMDYNGNVYVTGYSAGSGTGNDYATIKYDANGNQLWVQRYNGLANTSDEARSIAVDGSGNVYVTGYSAGSGTGLDYATIKYDTNGTQLWVQRYNGPANSNDDAQSIAVDGSGNVYVTGSSAGSGTGFDYATIKYDTNGTQLWVQRYNGPVNSGDAAQSIAVDSNGNVYVTGFSGSGTGADYATIKYDTNGTQLWVQRYNGPVNSNDVARSIAVDGSGTVYVTGYSPGSGTGNDYATIKYDTNGTQLWVQRYNGPANSSDLAQSIAVDSNSNVYVTGNSAGSGTGNDYATIKYDTNGNQLWVQQYNGPANSSDIARSIAVDSNSNVYVTGNSAGSGTGNDNATIKYDTNGNQLWVQRYNGPANGDDLALSIAVNGSGTVYVTGFSAGSGTGFDYATIKYTQVSLPDYAQSVSSLDFGSVGVGFSETGTFAISNTGTAALTISEINATGANAGQFEVSPSAFTIEPGDPAQEISVTFTPESEGLKSAALSISHNAAGSPATVVLSGTGVDVTPPATPAGLMATGGIHQVSLSWTGNGESDLSHYVIYRSTTSGFTPSPAHAIAQVPGFESSFVDENLTAGAYYYRITAVDESGNVSAAMAEVMATAKDPGNLQIAGKIYFSFGNHDIHQTAIYVMNPDGTGQTQLTDNTAGNTAPSLSPDGTKVLFVSNRSGNWKLYTMNLDGSGVVRVTNTPGSWAETYPAWSPDGTKIAFDSNLDGNREIYVINADGTGAVRLTNHSATDTSPVWSPDGSKIAFTSFRDGNAEIYVMDADGTGQINLTQNSNPDAFASWSPDGSKIAFSTQRHGPLEEIYVMNVNGTGQTRLTNNSAEDHAPVWSPDGKKIAFYSRRNNNIDIYTINVDGTGETRLTTVPADDAIPRWTHFQSIGAVTAGGSVSRALTIENQGAGLLDVSDISTNNGQFSVSPTNFSVPAGGNQIVTVIFTPTSLGTSYATLTIASDDPIAPSINLIINGVSNNQPPIANAGPDQTAECTGPNGAEVVLDGTGSSDPDDDPLTYAWSAPGITFDNPASPTPMGTFPHGTTTVMLTVTDPAGETDTDEVVISVVDTTPPVIALIGNAEITLECNIDTYTEAGATVTDACDENVELVIDGAVDVTALGEYTITYNATDASGNAAEQITRLVRVVDTTPPVIALIGNAEITLECNIDTYTEAGATVTDNCDPDPEVTVDGTVDVSQLGEYVLTYTVTDASGNSASVTRTITVVDTTPPAIASITGPVTVECTSSDGEDIELSVTAIDAADPAPNHLWEVQLSASIYQQIGTQANIVATFGLGVHIVRVTITDASQNATVSDPISIVVQDTTPPEIALNGADPLKLELGTAYNEPGATAQDLCDGDVSAGIVTSGSVDHAVEGAYAITYTVADASGNLAQKTRTVNVVTSPNSYVLIALHSMDINQKSNLYSGFVGVLDFGEPKFLAGKIELVVGQHVWSAPPVRISSPRVEVRQKAEILGRLVYTEADIAQKAEVTNPEQISAAFWPLFGPPPAAFELPEFRTGTPGTEDIELKQKESRTLEPSAYGEIKVKQKSTLTFTGGEYHIRDLDIGQDVNVRFEGPTTLLIAEKFGLDQKSTFGPAPGSGIQASDILIYVAGINGNSSNLSASPDAAKIGQNCTFAANLYAPNGNVYLRQKSHLTGSFIGKDVIVGQNVDVYLRSGWDMPGVIYDPQAPVAAKPVLAREEVPEPETLAFGIEQNYPNPFNPETQIAYHLAQAGNVSLIIYNTLGQQVRTLVSTYQPAGPYRVTWDSRDEIGRSVSSGVYIYRLVSNNQMQTRRMVLLK